MVFFKTSSKTYIFIFILLMKRYCFENDVSRFFVIFVVFGREADEIVLDIISNISIEISLIFQKIAYLNK